MISRILVFACLIGLADAPVIDAAPTDYQALVTMIDEQLQSADDPKEKARLYCYRARNQAKSGDVQKATDDYLAALNASYEGWILHELGQFMYKTGQYEKAYNVSVRVLNDFPYLKDEASLLKERSKRKWEEQELINNPPTITLDAVPDPNRVTRHDLIKQAETGRGSQKGSRTQSGQSAKPVYKYWGRHPATKHIPEPQQKHIDY